MPYRHDLDQPEATAIDRTRLLAGLRGYFEIHGIRVDWENVEEADDERLVNMVAMVCPFEPPEKQALLEAEDLDSRAKTLIALVEMAVLSTANDDSTQQ
jgi:Lon protease-like protein